MVRFRTALAYLLLGLPVSAGAEGPSILMPQTVRDAIGLNIHFTEPRPGEMMLLANAGVGRVRMDVGWHHVEKERGHYDFAKYDSLLSELDAVHVHAMLILDYGNVLYTGAQKTAPTTPEARAAFARFAAATVEHFKGRGVLWEIYNEPNNKEYWQLTPDGTTYAELALETAKAIKSVAPDEVLCGPALAGVDLPFLRKAIAAGLLGAVDAVTVHPYRQTMPETVGEDLDKLTAMIKTATPAGKTVPVLAGEWGYPIVWVDATTQVNYAARQMLYGLSRRLPLNVWYDWRRGGAAEGKLAIFGLIDAQPDAARELALRTTPLYDAVATVGRLLGPMHFAQRLPLTGKDRPDDYLLAFDGPGGRRYAMWTTRDTTEPFQVALPDGVYNLFDVWGRRLGPRNAKGGMPYRVTGSPIYVVPADRSASTLPVEPTEP